MLDPLQTLLSTLMLTQDYSNPSTIVLSLLEGFYNARYNLVLDNLYTSPELLQVLFENKTDAY